MESLSINDASGPGPPPGPSGQPQIPQQLPPQLFTTAASLLDLTDKKLIVTLRDGRKLIGILRSWDQFGNLVLQNTTERRFLPITNGASTALKSEGVADVDAARHLYSDEERGIYLVRGENIILMGEIDLDKDDEPPPASIEVSPHVLHTEDKKQAVERKRRDAVRLKKLRGLGFEGEHAGDVIF